MYRRILLKLSGEALMGNQTSAFDPDVIKAICADIATVVEMGVEVCLVVGGGNIFRGAFGEQLGIERASADYMGMLATVLNALAVQNVLEKMGVDTRVLSAITMTEVCEPYIRRRAIRHLERGRVVIFAAGTGNPFFTTDTAATLRAIEMGCQAILKGTQVDGVYDADPKHTATANRYETLSYAQVLADELKVMDATAIALARENRLPIVVFSIHTRTELARVVMGQGRFTLIGDKVSA